MLETETRKAAPDALRGSASETRGLLRFAITVQSRLRIGYVMG